MCDASDFAGGAVLGQRIDKNLNVIHYASKTLDSAQNNYATTEKECSAVVFACDKFRQYIVDSIVILWRRRMPNQGSSDGYCFFKNLTCILSIEKEHTIR